MMDIFIRSYRGDFKWLRYCMESLRKRATGFNKIFVVVPERDFKILQAQARVIGLSCGDIPVELGACPNYANDYLGQQVTKMTAWKYTEAEEVVFVDSDVVVTQPITPDSFRKGNKLFFYKTRYTLIPHEHGGFWKAITEKAIGFPVEYEYMRRLPLAYRVDTLKNVCEYMRGLNHPVESYIIGQPNREFSEFNAIGAYIDRFEKDKYTILDTDGGVEPALIRQFWSWGGITKDVQQEINEILR